MKIEDLNKKRDELAGDHYKNGTQCHAESFRIGFNACRDILLPEIDNGVIKYQNQYQYSKFYHSKAIQQTSKITQLEKENAELRTDIHLLTKTDKITVRHLKEPINEHHVYNIKEQSKVIDKLTAQLNLCKEQRDNYINNSYNGYQNGNKFEIDESNKQLEDVK